MGQQDNSGTAPNWLRITTYIGSGFSALVLILISFVLSELHDVNKNTTQFAAQIAVLQEKMNVGEGRLTKVEGWEGMIDNKFNKLTSYTDDFIKLYALKPNEIDHLKRRAQNITY